VFFITPQTKPYDKHIQWYPKPGVAHIGHQPIKKKDCRGRD